MNYIQTQKFSDVYVSCKTMMPFNRNTITALNVLVYMMKAKTEKMDSKQKLASTLNLAYGTKISYGLTSFGDLIQVDVRFQFVRPDWIEDENYVNKIKDIMDQALFHSVLDEENFKESVYLLKNRLLAQMDDPANLSCMYAFEMAHDKHSISIPVQGSLKDLETLTLKMSNKYIHSIWIWLNISIFVDMLIKNYMILLILWIRIVLLFQKEHCFQK